MTKLERTYDGEFFFSFPNLDAVATFYVPGWFDHVVRVERVEIITK